MHWPTLLAFDYRQIRSPLQCHHWRVHLPRWNRDWHIRWVFLGPYFAVSGSLSTKTPLGLSVLSRVRMLIPKLITAGPFTVAGPILQAFMIDVGLLTAQIANRSAIYPIAPKARNRINTAFMVSIFAGQLIGTAAGNSLYARGGWLRSGSANSGFIGIAILSCFARGPCK